jgi:hypothetical protein
MSKNRVGLRHDLATELDDRHITSRIHTTRLHEGGLDILAILIEGVADVVVNYANVGEQEGESPDSDHLRSRNSGLSGYHRFSH